MYNGGIFGGGPTGPLGIGVPSGWGNGDDIGSTAEQVLKDRAKVTSKESEQTGFLSWFPKANRSKFTFSNKGLNWGGKMIFPEGNRTHPDLIKDLGLDSGFPPQLLENRRGSILNAR